MCEIEFGFYLVAKDAIGDVNESVFLSIKQQANELFGRWSCHAQRILKPSEVFESDPKVRVKCKRHKILFSLSVLFKNPLNLRILDSHPQQPQSQIDLSESVDVLLVRPKLLLDDLVVA